MSGGLPTFPAVRSCDLTGVCAGFGGGECSFSFDFAVSAIAVSLFFSSSGARWTEFFAEPSSGETPGVSMSAADRIAFSISIRDFRSVTGFLVLGIPMFRKIMK
jgi:hypothetical protein